MNSNCISKLVVPGTLISFKINSKPTWSLNIITSCSGDTIDIPLTPDLMKFCLFLNAKIDIKYVNEYFEYIISGNVAKIELSGSPYISIKINDIKESVNQRVFPRRDIYLPASLTHRNSVYFCTITNLSLGGVAFLHNQKIDFIGECEINILLEYTGTVFAKGNILRCSKHDYLDNIYKYSMMFTYMDEENSNLLHSYFHDLEASFNKLGKLYL